MSGDYKYQQILHVQTFLVSFQCFNRRSGTQLQNGPFVSHNIREKVVITADLYRRNGSERAKVRPSSREEQASTENYKILNKEA